MWFVKTLKQVYYIFSLIANEFYDHITMYILITEAIWTCASVTTSTTLMPLSLKNCIPRRKQAFSRLVLFRSVLRLSIVVMHRIFLDVYSMKVYEQYCAQCPGLSIRPSPKNECMAMQNKISQVKWNMYTISWIPYFTLLFKFIFLYSI